MTEKRVMKLASRGKRFGAGCIDAFVPIVSYLLCSAVLSANGIKNYYPGYGYGFGNEFGYPYGYGYGYGIGRYHLNGASAAIMVVVFFILIAYIVAELILFARGKSIGKAILGLQVVSSTDGKPFRFWKMVFRECFVKSASGTVFGLGYIWILLDEKNRGWHDKILDSYVVDLKESERMNYRRHLEQMRNASAASAPEPAPLSEPETEPEVMEEEVIIPEVIPVEEVVAEAEPETIEPVIEEVSEELAVAEDTGEIPEEISEDIEDAAAEEKTEE